jgi:tetratricopeptide (TPR) repeat protein
MSTLQSKHNKHSNAKPKKHSEKKTLTERRVHAVYPLAGILILTFLLYLKSLKNGFTNYDDDVLIINNSMVHGLSATNLKLIFTSFLNGMYHPLVTLSWNIESSLLGEKAFHFHLVNLLFHLLNVWLVYRFVLMLSKKLSVAVLAGLLFAFHPMISESVLWLSERKDLLCTAFLLGGLVHYVKYLKNNFGLKYFVLTLVFFLFALFSKPSAIVFPLLLLVIDFYMGRKIDKKVLAEKFPFFVLSVSFGVIAVMAASSVEGINTLQDYNYLDRIIFAAYAIVFYILKFIFPFGLSAKHFYPLKDGAFLPVEYYIAVIILVILVYLIFKIRKQHREIVGGFLFFLASISVVLPLVPVGDSIVSERYSYVSYIGLILVVASLYEMYKNNIINRSTKLKPIFHVVIVIFLLFCAYSTFARIDVWKNSLSLWTDVIAKDPQASLAYTARGDYKVAVLDYPGAEADYSKAVQIDSLSAVALNNLGYVMIKEKEYKKAEADFARAIRLKPHFAKAYYNRSCLWIETAEYQKAIADCDKAISLLPDFDYAYYNRGNAKYLLKQYAEAVKDFDKAIEINSVMDVFYYYRALAFYEQKNFMMAKNDLNKTLNLSPKYFDAYYYRAKCSFNLKEYSDAISDLNKQIEHNPADVESIHRRGECKFFTQDYKGAVEDYTMAIAIDKAYAPAYYSRALANAELGTTENICADLKKAVELGLEISDESMMKKYCK